MTKPTLRAALLPVAVAFTFGLPACGSGSDDEPTDAPLNLTRAVPQQHVGALRAGPDTRASNESRAPDPFSPEAYCLVRYGGLVHTSGERYELAIAFSRIGQRVLAVTLNQRSTSWFVAAMNPGSVSAWIDFERRRVHLRQTRSTQGGQVDWEATIDGDVAIPASVDQPACG